MAGRSDTIAISKFKATCLEVLKRVKRTGKPVLVTRFGEPEAQVVPPPPPLPELTDRWIGSLASRGRIVSDIVCPALPEDEWEVLRA